MDATRVIRLPLPLRYEPPPDRFLARDGARYSRVFLARGIDARKVVIGDPDAHRVDAPELMLARWDQWCDPDWWRGQRCDRVLLYGGANPRLLPVARAIRQAGARLALQMDSSLGSPSIRSNPGGWLYRKYWSLREQNQSPLQAGAGALARAVLRFIPGLYDAPVLELLSFCHAVVLETPFAQEAFRRWYEPCKDRNPSLRIALLPHPVEPSFCPPDDPARRQAAILWVGRGDSRMKNVPRMAAVLNRVLLRRPGIRARIVGPGADRIRAVVSRLPPEVQQRIEILGALPASSVCREMQRARVLLVSSRVESFHIAAAEAVCCGASLVAGPGLPSLRWMAAENAGTVASRPTTAALTAALEHELDAWDRGRRDPAAMARMGAERFHADRLADRLLALLQE